MTQSDLSVSHPQPVLSPDAPRVRIEVANGQRAGMGIDLCRPVSLIGTRKGGKLVLKNQKVSPAHAAIINAGRCVYLRDLVSHQGTVLNGLRQDVEVLENGDEILIAGWKFRMSITSGQRNPEDPPGLMLPMIELMDRENGIGGVLSKPVSVIGRRGGCDVELPGKEVSRAHAIVFPYEDKVAIFDLLSKYGTHVNRQRVRFALLSDGDVIEIGHHQIDVKISSEGVPREVSATVQTSPARPAAAEPVDLIDLSKAELPLQRQ